MTSSSPYASDAQISAACALIGLPAMPQNTQQLWQAITLAFANRNAGGGDPQANLSTALGGAYLGVTEQVLLQQTFVLSATT